MSRIGKAPVEIPAGVDVAVSGSSIVVKGKSGTLTQAIPNNVNIAVDGGKVVITRSGESKQQRALHGLTRALVQNMVQGVSKGFTEELEIIGVGWNAKMKGKDLSLQIGFCHTVDFKVPAGVKVDLPNPQRIVVTGIDKQAIGAFAALVRKVRPPEPYKGKGIRYVGEHVIRKVGKSQVGK